EHADLLAVRAARSLGGLGGFVRRHTHVPVKPERMGAKDVFGLPRWHIRHCQHRLRARDRVLARHALGRLPCTELRGDVHLEPSLITYSSGSTRQASALARSVIALPDVRSASRLSRHCRFTSPQRTSASTAVPAKIANVRRPSKRLTGTAPAAAPVVLPASAASDGAAGDKSSGRMLTRTFALLTSARLGSRPTIRPNGVIAATRPVLVSISATVPAIR